MKIPEEVTETVREVCKADSNDASVQVAKAIDAVRALDTFDEFVQVLVDAEYVKPIASLPSHYCKPANVGCHRKT